MAENLSSGKLIWVVYPFGHGPVDIKKISMDYANKGILIELRYATSQSEFSPESVVESIMIINNRSQLSGAYVLSGWRSDLRCQIEVEYLKANKIPIVYEGG